MIAEFAASRSEDYEMFSSNLNESLGRDFMAKIFATAFRSHLTITEPLDCQAFTNRYGYMMGMPTSARRIYTASSSVGMAGRASRYRFDAPVADHVAYFERLIDTNKLTAVEPARITFLPRTHITNSPNPIDRAALAGDMVLTNLTWFDVETISKGLHGSGPPQGLGRLWADMAEGRVYYYWTD
ncbi:MAG: hypothetical protein ACPGVU_01175 [Limisphaerales bacterium]